MPTETPTPELLQWFATLGVGGVLAGLMFYFFRKDSHKFTEMWRGQAEAWQGQSEILMQLVKDNTRAITENTVTIKALHRRDDRIEAALTMLTGHKFPHQGRDRDRPEDEP